VVDHRWQPLNDVFIWLSRIGSWGAVWIALGLVVTLVQRRRQPVVLVALAVLAANGLASLLKVIVGSKRPADDGLITIPHSHSFPSGHAAMAFAGATVLSAFVPRAAPAFFVLAAAIAYSRVYLGVHWPLDVLGGAVLGVVTALLLLAAARRRSGRSPRAG
jgi:undecaprenyl-diphosphatase